MNFQNYVFVILPSSEQNKTSKYVTTVTHGHTSLFPLKSFLAVVNWGEFLLMGTGVHMSWVDPYWQMPFIYFLYMRATTANYSDLKVNNLWRNVLWLWDCWRHLCY